MQWLLHFIGSRICVPKFPRSFSTQWLQQRLHLALSSPVRFKQWFLELEVWRDASRSTRKRRRRRRKLMAFFCSGSSASNLARWSDVKMDALYIVDLGLQNLLHPVLQCPPVTFIDPVLQKITSVCGYRTWDFWTFVIFGNRWQVYSRCSRFFFWTFVIFVNRWQVQGKF